MKKYTSLLIGFVIIAVAFIVFAAWSKLTHKIYADDALAIAMVLQISVIVLAIIWGFYETKNNNSKVSDFIIKKR
jgi:ABC-type Mn2+/Zn2+ transport system permease subunit